MLKSTSLAIALPLTQTLDQKDIYVRAVTGSPLDILVKSCMKRDLIDIQGRPLEGQALEEAINSLCPIKGYDEHAIDMAELKTAVASAVRNHLALARTVVVPEVTHFVESVTPVIDEVSRDPLHEIEIVQCANYSFMAEPALLDSLERYKDQATYDIEGGFQHTTRTDEQVLELMKTGSITLDEAVAIYVSKLTPGTLQHVWETMFTNIPQPDGDSAKTTTQLLNEPEYAVCRSLVTFLVARNLISNPQEDAGMSLTAYKDLLNQYRTQAALGLLRAKYRQDLSNKVGYLVERIVKKDGFVKIFVNPTLYKEWINEGGDNTALFGLSTLDNPELTKSYITDNSVALKNVWDKHTVLTSTVVKLRKFNKIREILATEFNSHVANLSPEELPIQQRANVISKFNEALEKTKLDEVDNIHGLILRLVCTARYGHTSAYEILSTLDRVKKSNPNMDIKTAASIMTAMYVSKWVASMFRVESARR